MKKLFTLFLALMLIFAVVACSAPAYESSPMAPAAPPDVGYDYPVSDEAGRPMQDMQKAEGEIAGGFDSFAVVPDTNHKLIYTSSFSIETTEFANDYAKIINSLAIVNGYVSNENTYGSPPKEAGDSGRTAELSLRVPILAYSDFTKSLAGIGELMSKSQNVSDVTGQYYDTQARIDMLQNRYEKLTGYLKDATKIEDIMRIEAEISNLLYELDNLKGSKRKLDNLIDYATVSLTLREVMPKDTPTASEKLLGTRMGESFDNVIKGLGIFFDGFLVFLAGAFPVLLVLAVIFAIVMLIRKWTKKCRLTRKAKREAERRERIAAMDTYAKIDEDRK